MEITLMQDKLMVGLYIYLRKQSEKIKKEGSKKEEGGGEKEQGELKEGSLIKLIQATDQIRNQSFPSINSSNSSTSKPGILLLEQTIKILISSYTKHLEAMSEESFASLRMAGLVAWRRKEGSLLEKAGRLWKEIYFGEEEWDRREKMRENLKNMGKMEYVRFLKEFFGGRVVVLSFREEEGRRLEEEGYCKGKLEELNGEEEEGGKMREEKAARN